MRRSLVLAFVGALATTTSDAFAEGSDAVRVRVSLERAKDVADVSVERHGAWTIICQAPCTFDAMPGETIRVDLPGLTDVPLESTVPADAGAVHDIEVRRRGHAHFVGGLVAFAAGAVSLALGTAILRGAGDDDLFGGDANRWVGRIAVLLGAGSAATGVALVVTRSTTPFLVETRVEPSLPAPRAAVWTLRF